LNFSPNLNNPNELDRACHHIQARLPIKKRIMIEKKPTGF
jgi:hypothetical protein